MYFCVYECVCKVTLCAQESVHANITFAESCLLNMVRMIYSEKFSLSLNHGDQHLIRSVFLLFLLGKLTNHFWKVKLIPGLYYK